MQYSKQCKKVLGSMSDSDDDVPIFGKKPSALDSDDEPIFSLADFTGGPVQPALVQAVNINVQAQIERIRQGASKVRLIEPLLHANLAADVVMLVRACIDAQCVTSLELLVSPTRPCRRCTVNDLSFGRGPRSAQSTHRP